MSSYSMPMQKLIMVRDKSMSWEERPELGRPADAARVFRAYLREAFGGEDLDREVFMLATLSVRRKLIACHTISVGCLTSSLVHPREVFKAGIMDSAAVMVLCHNHPSGDPEPSAEDISLTRRLVQGGQLLGIEVLDHLVLGEGREVSMKDRGVV